MKIGRQEHRSSALSTSSADIIVVRGKDLCRDSRKDGFHRVLVVPATRRNCRARRKDACSTPPWWPSPNTASCPACRLPHDLRGCARSAAGRSGRRHPGLRFRDPRRRRASGQMLADVVTRARGTSLEAAATAVITELRAARKPIPGYGHPLHKGEDPRATRLFAVATEAGATGHASQRPRNRSRRCCRRSPARHWS